MKPQRTHSIPPWIRLPKKHQLRKSFDMYLGMLQRQLTEQFAKPTTDRVRPHPGTGLVPARKMKAEFEGKSIHGLALDPVEFSFNALIASINVLRGSTPPHVLRNILSDSLYLQIRRQHAHNQLTTKHPRSIAPRAKISLRASSSFQVSDHIREVTVLLEDGGRSRVGALRLERTHSAWRVTALTLA